MFVLNNELLIAWRKKLQNIVGCWCRHVLHILKRHRLKTDFKTTLFVLTFFAVSADVFCRQSGVADVFFLRFIVVVIEDVTLTSYP
jgi:membrane protein YqaA with SNARE-associated domain